jgi:hypothetical protein
MEIYRPAKKVPSTLPPPLVRLPAQDGHHSAPSWLSVKCLPCNNNYLQEFGTGVGTVSIHILALDHHPRHHRSHVLGGLSLDQSGLVGEDANTDYFLL